MTTKVLTTVVSVIIVASLGLVGCGTSSSTNNTTTGSSTTQNTTSNTTSTNTSSKTSAISAIVTLSPTKGSKVKGTATLTLDSKTHQLTIDVKATGFTPNSVHPEHIHNAKTGVVIYGLDNLTADKSGDATATTVIQGVKSIPATGWLINIHQSTKDLEVLASGDVITK